MSSGLLPHLEMSYSDVLETDTLSIALIGPDQERRSAVASALAGRPGVQVREFPTYPPALDKIAELLKLSFDVIVLDLDSDPAYAVQMIESICAKDSATVMVYSAEVNIDVAARCRRAGAREYLEAPFDKGVDEALARAAELSRSRRMSQSRSGSRQLVFFGAKGGSGTTTLACNYAIALAGVSGQRTLLIDLGLPLGDAALNLGLAAEFSTEDAFRDPGRLDPSLLEALVVKHTSGVSVLAAPAKVPEAAPSGAAIEKLLAVAHTLFDFIVVDVGSRVDLMNTALFAEASTIYMVTQAGISELRNADRLFSLYFGNDRKKLQIIVNRFDPNDSRITEEQMATALGAPMNWKIPDDYDATRQMQNASFSASGSYFSRLMAEMASSAAGLSAPPQYSDAADAKAETAQENPRDGSDRAGAQPQAFSPDGLPIVTWHTPAAIPYGTPLDDAQLNASAAIPGAFVYTPGPGYVLPVGTHTLWVTFTPESGSMVQSAVSITVVKVTPAIHWSAPDPISCDTALGDTQLNATATVPGKLEYSPAAGQHLDPGEHTLTVTFTPADHRNYAIAKASVPITVEHIKPVITWQKPAKIPFGGALSSKHLNATAPVPGVFTYTPAAGEVMESGEHTLKTLFTPADTAHYASAEATVTVTVMKAPPRIVWSAPDPIVYGTPLSTAQLNAAASVEGTFEYTPGPGSMLAVGEHTPSVTFTPQDTSDYGALQAAVPLTVVMAKPSIVWPAPPPIPAGMPLGDAQLNATSPVPGTFVYKPGAGEVLPTGTHTLSAIFTPLDSMNYEPARATVSLTVADLEHVEIKWPALKPIPYGTTLGDAQLNAAASVPGTFAYGPGPGTVLPAGQHTLSALFTPADRAHYAVAQATVALQVEPLPDVASILVAAAQTPIEQAIVLDQSGHAVGEQSAIRHGSAPPKPEKAPQESAAVPRQKNAPAAVTSAAAEASSIHAPARPIPVPAPNPDKPRETRTYKGVIYEKGDDGQWHRQQR